MITLIILEGVMGQGPLWSPVPWFIPWVTNASYQHLTEVPPLPWVLLPSELSLPNSPAHQGSAQRAPLPETLTIPWPLGIIPIESQFCLSYRMFCFLTECSVFTSLVAPLQADWKEGQFLFLHTVQTQLFMKFNECSRLSCGLCET